MAMADAGIASWKAKYDFYLWRPVLGVREAAKGYGRYALPSDKTFDAGTLPLPVPDMTEDIRAWLETKPDRSTTTYGEEPDTFESDPLWRPLGMPRTNVPGQFFRTPGFPAYPSGHATFGAACFQTVYHFLEDLGVETSEIESLCFDFISDEFNGKNIDPDGSVRPLHTRKLTIAQAIHENALSRIYLGVHWRIDAEEGTRLGVKIAESARYRLSGSTEEPIAVSERVPVEAVPAK